jgi:hypothetical protein
MDFMINDYNLLTKLRRDADSMLRDRLAIEAFPCGERLADIGEMGPGAVPKCIGTDGETGRGISRGRAERTGDGI